MAYTEEILFDLLENREGYEIFTIARFHKLCDKRWFNDHDGFGLLIKDGYKDPAYFVVPSLRHEIPEDATHILWYNT